MKVRLILTTEKSLGWQFRPRHESYQCPVECIACRTASKPGMCYAKNAVYQVDCQVCDAVYMGQTGRTMRSRIIEHAKGPQSHVYTHMSGHGRDNSLRFKWRILDSHRYLSMHLAREAMHIKRFPNSSLMNGCDGTLILPFLA
jgi:hypothetical protein